MKTLQAQVFLKRAVIRLGLFFAVWCVMVPIVWETKAAAQNASAEKISSDHGDELARQYKSLVESLVRISEIYYYEGKLDDAWKTLENAAPVLRRKEIARPDAVKFELQRGKILYYKNSLAGAGYQESIVFLLDTQKKAEAINNDYLKAAITDLVGLALYSQAFTDGDFAAPLRYFEQALAIRRKIDDRQGISESLFHLGLVYENKKNSMKEDKEKAFQYYKQSLDLAEKGGYKLEAAYDYRHLAYIYQERGDLDKALDYFTKSFQLREEIGFKIYLSPAALTIGDVYLAKKDYRRASEFYQKGLALAESLNANRFIVRALVALGEAQKIQGDSRKALEFFQRALKTAEEGKNTEGAKDAAEQIANLSKQ